MGERSRSQPLGPDSSHLTVFWKKGPGTSLMLLERTAQDTSDCAASCVRSLVVQLNDGRCAACFYRLRSGHEHA
eukprot:769215-Alexandrium_andersonii.AAC.1